MPIQGIIVATGDEPEVRTATWRSFFWHGVPYHVCPPCLHVEHSCCHDLRFFDEVCVHLFATEVSMVFWRFVVCAPRDEPALAITIEFGVVFTKVTNGLGPRTVMQWFRTLIRHNTLPQSSRGAHHVNLSPKHTLPGSVAPGAWHPSCPPSLEASCWSYSTGLALGHAYVYSFPVGLLLPPKTNSNITVCEMFVEY